MQKVLIANRGEIAVRVIRACRDAGYAVGRGLRRARPRRPARADGRRGVRAGRHDAGRLLPGHRQDHRGVPQSGADAVHPGYGFLSENADFAQAVIDAGLTWIGPSPAVDPRPRRQGGRAAHRRARRRAARRRHQGPGQGRRRGRRLRRGERPADRDQGRLRRRRARHEDRPRDGGGRRPLRVRGARGDVGVRPRRVLRRALPRPLAARRGAGAGRPARQRHRRRHPRLLAAAAQPEAGRGGARAVPHRRPARDDPRLGQGHLQGGRLLRRRHRRVPRRRRRRDQLPRGQHPPAGRAPGHRADQRHRPRARAVPHRRGREAALHRGPRAARARLRVPHQRRGPGPQLPARPRHGHQVRRAGRPGRARRLRHRGRRRSSAARSTRCWPS